MIVLLIWLALAISGVVNEDMVYKNDGDLDLFFKCLEDGSSIGRYQRCDGIANCPNGSDESFVECKEYVNFSEEEEDPDIKPFVCANGASPHEAEACNENKQCSDGSDELIIGCVHNATQFIRGECSSSYMQCHSGDCILEKKMCDGHVDCIDGRDESLELCFRLHCKYPYFQCGNGFCIDPNKLCDNKFDCIDGSDETPRVCENICESSNVHEMCKQFKGWSRNEPARCIEPIEQGIEFMNTKFHKIKNEKFVYANGIVQFKCNGQKDTKENKNWNVCLNTGVWRNPLPKCKKLNTNATTNGSTGCPLNYYSEEKMKITQCELYGECKWPVQLPLNNKRVKIECNHGYSLVSPGIESRTAIIQICSNRRWVNSGSTEPECTKFCNGTQISHLYALDLECKECVDNEYVRPGVIANFTCSFGFHDIKKKPLPELECLENGMWKGLDNLIKHQRELCAHNCMNKDTSGSPLSKNGTPALPTEAPWTTAIFQNGNFTCTGTLIRLDLVLTAAHCLLSKSSKRVDTHQISVRYLQIYNGTVPTTAVDIQEYQIHDKYVPLGHLYDVAILFLKKKVTAPVKPGIVCLPWLEKANFIYTMNKQVGFIDTFNSDNLTLSVVSFDDVVNSNYADLFHIRASREICKGDSGSPVVVQCKSGEWEGKCLIGLVTSSSSSKNDCSVDITVANISYYVVKNFIDYYENNFPTLIH